MVANAFCNVDKLSQVVWPIAAIFLQTPGMGADRAGTVMSVTVSVFLATTGHFLLVIPKF